MDLERNRIYELVRNEIISCSLMPGVEIREADLAQRFGVSKSPIRDAMQKLEFEGLVDISPRRGHRIRPISVQDTEDILELRIVLEVATVKKLARTATEEELKELDRFRDADQSSIESFARYNRDFHRTLSTLSKNQRLAQESHRIMDLYDRLIVISLSALTAEGNFETPLRDHNEIIDALQDRNGNAAARVVRRHVGRSRGQIMRVLESRPIIG